MAELQLPKLLTWVRFPSPAPFLLWAAAAAAAGTAQADAIDDYVRAEMERQRIPGLALAVVRNGEPVKLAGYGESNVEHHVPVRPETVFQSGSVGKQFAAAGVQLLVAEGKVRYDDPLSRWFSPVPEAWKDITVRHLLTHTSGITEYTEGESVEVDFRRDYTEDELVELAKRAPLDFAPGEKWSYSNTGYLLLGALMRRASGEFYGDYLTRRIFRPLGMATTQVITEENIVPNRAAGYRLVDGALKNQEWVAPSINTTADGALYLSILDLVRWDQGLRDGRVLSKEQLDLAWTPVRLSDGTTYPYGFGWSVSEQRGSRLIEHGGSWQGFRSQISRYVEEDLTVIVLANSAEAEPGHIAHAVAGLAAPALAMPDKTRPPPDPEPRRTKAVLDALIAWGGGGSPRGLVARFAGDNGEDSDAAYFRDIATWTKKRRQSIRYLGEDAVAGRGIERNGAQIARILYLGKTDIAVADLLAIYLDGDDRVAALTIWRPLATR